MITPNIEIMTKLTNLSISATADASPRGTFSSLLRKYIMANSPSFEGKIAPKTVLNNEYFNNLMNGNVFFVPIKSTFRFNAITKIGKFSKTTIRGRKDKFSRRKVLKIFWGLILRNKKTMINIPKVTFKKALIPNPTNQRM